MLAARKRAKADLKVFFSMLSVRKFAIPVFLSIKNSPLIIHQEAKDPLERAVLDGRQLALKVLSYLSSSFCKKIRT